MEDQALELLRILSEMQALQASCDTFPANLSELTESLMAHHRFNERVDALTFEQYTKADRFLDDSRFHLSTYQNMRAIMDRMDEAMDSCIRVTECHIAGWTECVEGTDQ